MNGVELPLTADLVVLKDAEDDISLGCTAEAYDGTDVDGKIVAIRRGDCPFVDKGAVAEAAGAAGSSCSIAWTCPATSCPSSSGSTRSCSTSR